MLIKQNKPLEYILVFVQFATLGYVVFTTSWQSMPLWLLIIPVIQRHHSGAISAT